MKKKELSKLKTQYLLRSKWKSIIRELTSDIGAWAEFEKSKSLRKFIIYYICLIHGRYPCKVGKYLLLI
jgi:hypothetical protein